MFWKYWISINSECSQAYLHKGKVESVVGVEAAHLTLHPSLLVHRWFTGGTYELS